MNCQREFEIIDELYPHYLDVWEEVCSMESPTPDKEAVDKVGKYFIDIAEKRGWKTEIFENPILGNVVTLTMNPDVPEAPITFSGHLDTVHPIGSFGTPAVRRDSEKIYGPGVDDCKGGVVAALYAMDVLDRCGFDRRPVRLILQGDEEGGSRPSNKPNINYICEKAKDSVAFINLEGHTKGLACIERKGILTYTFKVTGQEAHSAACHKEGASAICEAAHKILELEKFKDGSGITCNCGIISGGKTHNTVPGDCEFRANFRFVNAEQYAHIDKFVHELADRVYVPGCSTAVVVFGSRPAMERVERNVKLLSRINDLFEENGMARLGEEKRIGGADSAQVSAAGIPCVDGLGVHGGRAHSLEEFAYLESLRQSAKWLTAIACGI